MSDDRTAFAERIRLQLRARYRGTDVNVDPQRFAVRVTAPGVDTTLPLSPLYHACERQPSGAAALITDFVRSVERRLLAPPDTGFDAGRVLWCVRDRSYLREHSGTPDLLVRDVAGGVVAFVAESLPGVVMRGLARHTWTERGVDDATVRGAADANTAARFAPVAERIREASRVPRDGWRLTGDVLFQSSLLVVPAVLRALADRAGGEVLVAAPERAALLALPVAAANAEGFRQRVLRSFRESMAPCSAEVLVTDGVELRVAPRPQRSRSSVGLLAWLREEM